MNWLIYGCGGHGNVVWDILRAMGVPNKQIFLHDDRYQQGDRSTLALAIPAGWQMLRGVPKEPHQFIVAIGDNDTRWTLHMELIRKGHVPAGAVHPTATVSPSALIGGNVVICAHANVGPKAIIEDGCIVNTGASVEHGCRLGIFSHLSPGAVLCGDVQTSTRCWIGAGATVLPGAVLRDHATVGAGAVVLQDAVVEAGDTLVGVPARRKLKRRVV